MSKVVVRIWLLFFALVLLIGACRFSGGSIHTDLRALLPVSDNSSLASQILAHSTQASGDVWILVGSDSVDKAATAARTMTQSLARSNLQANSPAETFDLKSFARALVPYRHNFLTEKDRLFLQQASDKDLLQRSLSLLYRPFSASLVPFQDDPLGTFENALMEQAGSSALQFSGPCVHLRKPVEGLHYCVLQLKIRDPMRVSADMVVSGALRQAENLVLEADPQARIHSAGVALISEETAATASEEASLIGALSSLGILILVIVFFARLIPLLLTLCVLIASLVFACASVLALFGEIHILTLVFGATLLGICVDYVFHMLCATATGLSGLQAKDKLFKPLTLSLLTTCIGYAVMALSPMPGLQQMAVFCIAGLVSAYMSVLFLAGGFLKPAYATRAAAAFSCHFARLPRLQGKTKAIFIVLALIGSATGALQLQTQNELALLNRIPPHLLSDMKFVGSALSPVSPGQLFVIESKDTETVLQTAEVLHKRLSKLAAQGVIGNSLNPTAFLASVQTQKQNRSLIEPLQARALELVENTLQIPFPPAADAEQTSPLTLSAFRSIAPEMLTRFWLSDTTLLVPLSGVTAASLPSLQSLALDLPGVRFVNTTAEVAASLAQYRDGVFYALLLTLAVIGVILAASLRKRFLNFWLPTLLSLALTLGLCGFAEIPFSLFSVLPLVLVVGLGVDYAIVLYSEANAVAARNSVFLAAASTLLAFGLLAFSSTPALHIFGLTLLLAMGCVLVTTVLLRPEQ